MSKNSDGTGVWSLFSAENLCSISEMGQDMTKVTIDDQ